MCVPVAQLDRVLPSEGKGRKFDSCQGHHLDILAHKYSFRKNRL